MIPFLALPALSRIPWKWVGAGVIALALAGAVVYHKVTVAGLEKRNADLRAVVAETQAMLVTANGNVTTLRASLRRANDAVAQLHIDALALEAQARERAVAALEAGPERDAIRRATPGHEEMNAWLESYFSR